MTEYITKWNPSKSNTHLLFTNNDTCVERAGNLSRSPVAFCDIYQPISIWTVKIEKAGAAKSWLTFGLSRKGMKNVSSDGMGRASNTWGFFDDRSSGGSSVGYSGNKSVKKFRKFKVGDKMTAVLNLHLKKLWLQLNDGEVVQEFPVEGPTSPGDYWFGMSLANHHKISIISSPTAVTLAFPCLEFTVPEATSAQDEESSDEEDTDTRDLNEQFIELVQSSVLTLVVNIQQSKVRKLWNRIDQFTLRRMVDEFLKARQEMFLVDFVENNDPHQPISISSSSSIPPKAKISLNLSYNIRTTDLNQLLAVVVFSKKNGEKKIISSRSDFPILQISPLILSNSASRVVEYTAFVKDIFVMKSKILLSGNRGSLDELLTFALTFPTYSLDDIEEKAHLYELPEFRMNEDEYKSTSRTKTTSFYHLQDTHTLSIADGTKERTLCLSKFRKAMVVGTESEFHTSNLEVSIPGLLRRLSELLKIPNPSLTALHAGHCRLLRTLRSVLSWRRNMQNAKYELSELREVQPVVEAYTAKILDDLSKVSSVIAEASLDISPAQRDVISGDLLFIDANDNQTKKLSLRGYTDLKLTDQNDKRRSIIEIKTCFDGLFKTEAFAPKDQLLGQLQLLAQSSNPKAYCIGALTDLFVISSAIRLPDSFHERNRFYVTRRVFDLESYVSMLYLQCFLSCVVGSEEMMTNVIRLVGSISNEPDEDDVEDDPLLIDDEEHNNLLHFLSDTDPDEARGRGGGRGSVDGTRRSHIKRKQTSSKRVNSKEDRQSKREKKGGDDNYSLAEEEQREADIDYAYLLSWKRRGRLNSLSLSEDKENLATNLGEKAAELISFRREVFLNQHVN